MNNLIQTYINELKSRQINNDWYNYGLIRQKIFQKYLDNKDITGLLNFYDVLRRQLSDELNMKIDVFVNDIKDNFNTVVLQKFVMEHCKDVQLKAFYLDFSMYSLEIFACEDFKSNSESWASDFYDSQSLLEIENQIDYEFDGFSDAISSDYINAYILKLVYETLIIKVECSSAKYGYAQSDYPIVSFSL